jgi:putative flippase GtrA
LAQQFRLPDDGGRMMQLLRRTSRYAQVGLICALLNNVVVIAMDRLGYHYAIGVTVAFLTVTLVGYLLHTTYTFGVRASRAGGMRFMAANLSSFPLAMGAMFVLCSGLELRASIAMPIATVLLFAWNFLLAHVVIAWRAPQRS